jgi:hypothetical protein
LPWHVSLPSAFGAVRSASDSHWVASGKRTLYRRRPRRQRSVVQARVFEVRRNSAAR